MHSHLYRFRPVQTLLGKREELRRQEIYFASPHQLNDPMEGFSDVFWQGDAIVWSNLLRHYLVCLERAFSLLMILGHEHPTTWDQIPVVDPGEHRAATPQHAAIHTAIFTRFFADADAQALVAALAARDGPIRRHELSLHLTCAHPFALLAIREAHRESKDAGLPTPDVAEVLAAKAQLRHSAALIAQLKALKSAEPIDEDAIDTLFGFQRLMHEQMALANVHNQVIDPKKTALNFVLQGFAEGYVDQVERNLYPDWYAACFMEDCSNSSIWGTYGEDHKGVCLRFRTTVHDGCHSLTLNRIHGANADGPTRREVSTPFDKVVYTSEHASIDFFASLGRLPHPVLNKYWYSGANGERSSSAAAMRASTDDWRQAYWRNFTFRTTRKLKEWRFEAEHRLVIHSQLNDLSAPEARNATYRFEDLDGVIFGIRTPRDVKLDIFRVIEDKCRAVGRTDFKFFQAYYSRSKGAIEHHELGLLKFRPPDEGETAVGPPALAG
ncbi:MAG: DUF2971 domain-containing protein [Proteobacteria bacterium]|nr:DUF2971 domain-containing protein [Pseudomonadota bacterium]